VSSHLKKSIEVLIRVKHKSGPCAFGVYQISLWIFKSDKISSCVFRSCKINHFVYFLIVSHLTCVKKKKKLSNHIKPLVPSPYSHCSGMIKYCQINSPFSSFASLLQPCHITRNKITLIPSWNRGVSFMPNLSSFPLHRHSSLITKNCTRKK